MHDSKPRKPPACDACKARRVLCHPQPNGAPCPRCAEKDIQCTTTAVPRGRPRKNPVLPSRGTLLSPDATPNLVSEASSSSSTMTLRSSQVIGEIDECPELTPSLVAHLFQCFDRMDPATNPLIASTSIRTTIRTVSFQLHFLPPQSRALALCIIALSSLVSFHEVILGEGPRPESFSDQAFFSSRRDVLSCGARRSVACHALHAEALKAAWDSGVMLQVSKENAASSFLLDVLEQCNNLPTFPGANLTPCLQWMSAALRGLGRLHIFLICELLPPCGGPRPLLHLMGITGADTSWPKRFRRPAAGNLFYCRHFCPFSVVFNVDMCYSTHADQVLLTGPEPPAVEKLLASLESSSRTSGASLIFQSMRPYMFHVTCLARQLWETITGDHARLSPITEGAVIHFLGSLSTTHTILTRLLERADATLLTSGSKDQMPFSDDGGSLVRHCARGISLGFAAITLPLHRELEYRERTYSADEGVHTQPLMRLLRSQAHEMAVLGAREFARAIRYLPPTRVAQIKFSTVRDYAEFALNEIEGALGFSNEQVRDLETIAEELFLSGYSLDLYSSPQNASLVERLETYINSVRYAPESPEPGNMFMPLDEAWLGTVSEVGTLGIPIEKDGS
ncbi:hypothetical protein FB451DRAFT_1372994 [Mycena latifolia]|nr:hypothetical protein FB451DRAFT_1372994 [Mycena latifolia]